MVGLVFGGVSGHDDGPPESLAVANDQVEPSANHRHDCPVTGPGDHPGHAPLDRPPSACGIAEFVQEGRVEPWFQAENRLVLDCGAGRGNLPRSNPRADFAQRLSQEQAPIGERGADQAAKPRRPGRSLWIQVKVDHSWPMDGATDGREFMAGRCGDRLFDLSEPPPWRPVTMDIGLRGSNQDHADARGRPAVGQSRQAVAGSPVESLEEKLHRGG